MFQVAVILSNVANRVRNGRQELTRQRRHRGRQYAFVEVGSDHSPPAVRERPLSANQREYQLRRANVGFGRSAGVAGGAGEGGRASRMRPLDINTADVRDSVIRIDMSIDKMISRQGGW